jgi:phosphatidate cytidylyltransferase
MVEVDALLLWSVAAIFAALCAGSAVRIVALRRADPEVAQSRMQSLRTWWVLAVLIAAAALFGRNGILVLLALSAVLALREFMLLVGREKIGWPTMIAVFVLAVAYFVLLVMGPVDKVRAAAPVVFVIGLGGLRAGLGLIEGYIRATAAMFWGLMLFAWCLSHASMLPDASPLSESHGGNVGWFLFLILTTESNDIMQAITGRRFGKRRITPRVSPKKSLEGLLGGLVATIVLSVVAAPWLTDLTRDRSWSEGRLITAAAGLGISIFGFLGDINMSAIKRDAGVKDGSRLLPGQGGMIDRIDSLTFTAPAFYYFVRLVM